MSSKKLGLSVVTIATGQKLQRDFNFFFLKIDHLWSFNAFSKKLKQKGKFLDKLGQTICSFFSRFSTVSLLDKRSKTNFYH